LNLTFGLLWVEDEYSDAEERELIKLSQIAGFELKVTNSVDGADIKELAERQNKFHEFDLILLDLTLDKGVKGDELAEEIRRLFKFTPILFYSSKEPVKTLRARMTDKEIEGVYCAHRDGFLVRAGEIISDTAKSLNRLSGMRGLAMEVVAEADLLCKQVILELSNQEHGDFVMESFKESVMSLAEKNLKEFPALTDVDSQLASRAVDSMKLFGVFRELIKKQIKDAPAGEAKDRLRALNNTLKRYRDEVISVRNTLGHALETEADDGWEILDENGDAFMTVSDFPTHRSAFLRSLRSIRDIHEIVMAKNFHQGTSNPSC